MCWNVLHIKALLVDDMGCFKNLCVFSYDFPGDKSRSFLAETQGCAPLLSQLPTDQLGPAEQHREVVGTRFGRMGDGKEKS